MKVYLHNPNSPPNLSDVMVCEIDDDGTSVPGYVYGTTVDAVRALLAKNPADPLSGNEAILQVLLFWNNNVTGPDWVAVDREHRSVTKARDFQRFLSEFWDCPTVPLQQAQQQLDDGRLLPGMTV